MIPCPKCKTRTDVIDCRLVGTAVKRRRACPKCYHRFSTKEQAHNFMDRRRRYPAFQENPDE